MARDYLAASGGTFDEKSFVEYLRAVQEAQALEMGEIWGVKPALQILLLETIGGIAQQMTAIPRVPDRLVADLSRCIGAVRGVSEAQWKEIFEEASAVDCILRSDPAGAYAHMDFESRELYRQAVAELATHSEAEEAGVAGEAVTLAREAESLDTPLDRLRERQRHVGYYLIDRGVPMLRARIGYRRPLGARVVDLIRNCPNAFYMVSIEILAIGLVFALLAGLDIHTPILAGLLLLLVPTSQAAVDLVNGLVNHLLPPRRLAKLDFSEGIPEDCATMVAVPTLLLEERQVRRLADDLEVRYLGNRDPNLYFALVTDAPDSGQPADEKDQLASLCRKLVEDLNRRHAGGPVGRFFLFHRHRVFNPCENAWMGWERKRGKILDLNRLLRGQYDSFPVKVSDPTVLPRIRYVITLDTDTQLPREIASKLVGAIAHPLNRAVIDPATQMVVEGYGILQPRVGVSVHSAGQSRLASIYSGQTGFDIYTRAISDVYQDLFAEGIFTGKGIYEVDTFREVLEYRFPNNALLSHDLIEGAYARAALASDIEVIDDYPSHFSAFSRRRHRWVRGDWQTMRWLLPIVPDYFGRPILNPTTLISRWKILDNLRRSLIEPATLALLLAGWFFLAGTPAYWTAATLVILLLPSCLRLVFGLWRALWSRSPSVLVDVVDGFLKSLVSVGLSIVFLAHQSLTMTDAVLRSLVRQAITRRRLLEWETAAQAETGAKRNPVDTYLALAPWLALAIGGALWFVRPAALPVAAPFLLAWLCSKSIAGWLNRPPKAGRLKAPAEDQRFLRMVALRTWRYFSETSNAACHWLVPDNVEEETGSPAHTISPTNLGVLLNARLAAVEFGYLTLNEFLDQTAAVLSAVESLPRFHGHLFNWYNTRTLRPLPPLFVSTVDSGNLAASLWTLAQACRRLAHQPLLRTPVWQGIRDHVWWIEELAPGRAAAALATMEQLGEDPAAWLRCLDHLPERLANELDGAPGAQELIERINAVREMTRAGDRRGELEQIALRAGRLVAEMDFRFLFNSKRKLLTVGYDTGLGRPHPSYYDLLASEARTAVFIAIAKGDIPRQGWFHLGRSHTRQPGGTVLQSWTGTMFEYLMPALWMRTYERSILDRSTRAAVAVQREYAVSAGTPWGISEAAFGGPSDRGYQAFGIPGLALKRGTRAVNIISPYSTFLALSVDVRAALENLRVLEAHGLIGRYGFYDSGDFTGRYPRPVRCWMAHHQGMILVSLANLLFDNVFREDFHSQPEVIATELLLQEKPPRLIAVECDEESSHILWRLASAVVSALREFGRPRAGGKDARAAAGA